MHQIFGRTYMIKIFLAILALVGIAVILLSVRVIFRKNGRFVNSHVGASKAMKDRGIYCVQTQDKMEREKETWFDREAEKKKK